MSFAVSTGPDLAQQAGAVLALRRRRRGVELASFGAYLRAVTPDWTWDWPHLVAIQQALGRVTSGAVDRLHVAMPPRHGKTETKVRYAAYRLECDPTTRIIVVSYNQTLAEKISRKIRRLVRDRGMRLSEERDTAAEWETTAGGGVRAAGIGAGVTGMGADLLMIDDPVKSREEAESPTFQSRTWEAWTDDLVTRLEPRGAVVLTMTRWHHLDLAGRILADPQGAEWATLVLPALAEANDPLGRAPGAALCPARFDVDELTRIRLTMGEYGFGALYQQRPTPRTGNMFPRGLAEIVDALPAAGVRWCRGWDKAGTAGGGKRTAGVKVGVAADGHVYVADTVVGQWAAREREQVMRQTAQTDGIGVAVAVEQEPGSGGKESMTATIINLGGYAVVPKLPTGDKSTRASAFAAQWQAGNVRLLRGEWNAGFLSEMELAPHGTYVDRMDAVALAYNHLALGSLPMRPVRVRY